MSSLGRPRVHLRLVGSTNQAARELAQSGAPHGTAVTATEQTAGRGRQGRTWTAPPGRAVLASIVIRDPRRLLPLVAGVAVAEVVAAHTSSVALIKWPNDVLIDGRKVAGILVEGRPQEAWAIVGMGINVAVERDDFPPELRGVAGTLGLEAAAVEPVLGRLMDALGGWLAASDDTVLEAVRTRDALRGQVVQWAGGQGQAADIDEHGRLVVLVGQDRVALEAGEVHLVRS